MLEAEQRAMQVQIDDQARSLRSLEGELQITKELLRVSIAAGRRPEQHGGPDF